MRKKLYYYPRRIHEDEKEMLDGLQGQDVQYAMDILVKL